MQTEKKQKRSLLKTRDLWKKTAKSTLFADKVATWFITVVGFGSIVTLFGILFFLIQTVWPLLKPESLDLTFSTKPASLENRVYVDGDHPLGLIQKSENNGCLFQSVILSENRTVANFYLQTSEAGQLSFGSEAHTQKNETRCISQSDESIIIADGQSLAAAFVEFNNTALSTEESQSLPQDVFALLKKNKYAVHGNIILTQNSAASLVTRWTPEIRKAADLSSSFLEMRPWVRTAAHDGRLEVRLPAEGLKLVVSKDAAQRQMITNAFVLKETTNPITDEVTSETLDVAFPSSFQGVAHAVELIAARELWLMDENQNIERVALDGSVIGRVESDKQNTNSKIIQRVWGGDSLFVADTLQNLCYLIDAGHYSRLAATAVENGQPAPRLERVWSIDCPKHIKFAVTHPSARVIFLLTDDSLVGIETTTHRTLFTTSISKILNTQLGEIDDIRVSNQGNYLKFYHQGRVDVVKFNAPHLDASFSSYFKAQRYDGYEKKEFVWQSTSGSEEFQPKFSLVPLIWGTLKATFYAILFAGPIGIFAAIYSSEFLDRNTRNIVKPTVELMASVPSVVLGFLAAIVIAPWVEQHVVSVMLAGLTTPFLMFLLGSVLSNLSAKYISRRGLYASRLLLLWLVVGCLLCFFITAKMGQLIEHTAFGGNIKDFLSGGPGSEAALWSILLLPLVLIILWSLPIRQYVKAYKIIAFCIAPVLTFSIGLYFSTGDVLRSSVMASYAQRNTLVISIAMGFAIIPIIYSIAEDALSAVPPQLRAGSLACGASVWQTTAHVVVPTAASGIFSALMIGIGRAVGETMIVVMATGNTPVMGVNPFEGLRSLAANIAVELPEAPQGGTHYRTLFLSALVLFFFTFLLNSVAEFLRYRIRQRIKAL